MAIQIGPIREGSEREILLTLKRRLGEQEEPIDLTQATAVVLVLIGAGEDISTLQVHRVGDPTSILELTANAAQGEAAIRPRRDTFRATLSPYKFFCWVLLDGRWVDVPGDTWFELTVLPAYGTQTL